MSSHGKSFKYIFVSGGVLSSLGKGITTASIALLLKSRGYSVTIVKCENYLNLDSGLINPIEHGDPFLCDDGTEADMDLGTYEKFLDQNMGAHNFVTLGQIYKSVIDRERNFGYGGEDVEMPHVCDEIIGRINRAGEIENADIIITELGGTAGEYLNVLYYEASRILEYRNDQQVLHVHVSYLPTPPHIGEPKTKPTQLSVQRLNAMGIQPDFIVARSEQPMDERRRERFALFCNVKPNHIITNPDLPTVYQAPLVFAEQEFDQKILTSLRLPVKKINLKTWETMVEQTLAAKTKTVRIGIVGKYLATGEYQLRDSYAALYDALSHAATKTNLKLEIKWIKAQDLEKPNADPQKILGELQGIIVPIGWGSRGVEGKIAAIKFARENKIPYLGLCYGMQLAAVEFARHVVGLKDAHTTEVDPETKNPIIYNIPFNQKYQRIKGDGTSMRLGAYDCVIKPGTLVDKIYTQEKAYLNSDKHLVSERHRHRFEFNNKYRSVLEQAGLIVSATSPDDFFVEMIELPKEAHPFFVGTQAHPEYKSRPLAPHPIFLKFLEAAKKVL